MSTRPVLVGMAVATLTVILPLAVGHADDSGTGSDTSSDEEQGSADTDKDARTHFRVGRAYYDSGRFKKAAQEFEQAYELSGRPQLLYNIFLAYRDAGELGPAINALESFLDKVDDVEKRDSLEARLKTMRKLHEQQASDDDDGDEAESGAEEPAASGSAEEPSETPEEETAAGESEAPESAETSPKSGDADPASASGQTSKDTSSGSAEGAGHGEAVSGSAESGVNRAQLAGWLVVGAGVAMLAGATATGVMARNAESDLKKDDRCRDLNDNGNYVCEPGVQGEINRGEKLATATDVLIAAGILTAGAGVALMFLLDDTTSEGGPKATVGCTGHGCMGHVRVPF